MAAGAHRAGRANAEDREAAKVRRQKIFVAVAGVVLIGLLGFQLPGLLGSSSGSGSPSSSGSGSPSSSGSGSPSAALSAGVAVPITRGAPGSNASTSATPRWARLASRDLFVPQVSATTGAAAPTAAGVIPVGPAVRATHFVTKDVFVPQITVPAASAATSSPVTSAGGAGSTAASPRAISGGGSGYIVAIASIPGIGTASRQAAARGVVAAQNAGLQDVAANDAVPGESGSSPHFTVYTGPYLTEATAKRELLRALHDGYPRAHAQLLPTSTGKGF